MASLFYPPVSSDRRLDPATVLLLRSAHSRSKLLVKQSKGLKSAHLARTELRPVHLSSP